MALRAYRDCRGATDEDQVKRAKSAKVEETVHTRSDVVAGVPQPIVITDTNPSSPYYGVYASCIETDEGTVGTGGKDSITKTTFSSCTTNAPCTVTVAQSSAAWSTQAEKEGAAFFDTIKIEAGGLKITFTGGTECVSLTASGSVSQTWANRGTGEAGDSTFTNATGLTLFPPVDSTVVNGTIEVARSFSPLSKIFMS
jgi:hypothetical protein